MKHKIAAISFLLFAGQAFADGMVEGSAEAGKDKSVTCGACHGGDGNSVNPEWPSLAGQHPRYIAEQLVAFQKGTRANPLMTAQAAALSAEDIANLAVFYGEQTPAPRAIADESLLDKGEALYRGGDKERGIPACMACHGPSGSGNAAAAYPSLSGQHATYTAAQLNAYADGSRKSDGSTKVMREIAELLTPEQIKAISSYVQGLH